ncbi:class I SAM-dependent methyltransferase [Paenibacillus dakarensis]|uniref:class I SAM-dependent methyltransferase n=1 Tax=Paenibacillus dakarensis TaxID=1527293 RepID=UPI000AE766E2|nr:class I SAM-dependent methyltransferase [Paenibacillus dakarensis]
MIDIENLENVRQFYDQTVNYEWDRLERHKVEFELTKRYIKRYLKPNDRVLDLGGGPGRYSLFLSELGCDVTLADLSHNNVTYAMNKAQKLGLPLEGLIVDSRDLSSIGDEQYDHVLCMGPMYHLLNEKDRIKTVKECLKKLKQNGTYFVAFVSSYSFVWDYLIQNPALILDKKRKSDLEFMINDQNFAGHGWSDNYFIRPHDILPFFEKFELEKLHLINCESFLYMREAELLNQPLDVVSAWLDLAEQVCEREDFLSLAEHLMYIGRKK